MTIPPPTPIYRLIHIDNLGICLKREGLYAWNNSPDDGLQWRTIHDQAVQESRHVMPIKCGPGGLLHDYVPFYFGYLSPMMLKLNTGQVADYSEGQEPLIYLVSSVQAIDRGQHQYVFSDGHALAALTNLFDQVSDLVNVDWTMVYQRYWQDIRGGDDDRQRRKQAEFLVHKFCDWEHIEKIVVIDFEKKAQVEQIQAAFPEKLHRLVEVNKEWYYW